MWRVYWILALACVANAAPIVYVVNGNQQFGTVDLSTGAFQQIGLTTPEGESGLVPGPNGTLLTLTLSGNLDAIDPSTGTTKLVGATGLGDCSLTTSPCGPTSAGSLAYLNGKYYATDFQQNLYSINPATGQATLIGATGMPAVTFVPFGAPNADGTFNFIGGGPFGAGGNLYATFFTGTIDFETGTITPVITDTLYQIDPVTGKATAIAPTAFGLDAFANIGGIQYAFKNDTSQIVTLNLANGSTSVVSSFDQAAGLVFGASPVPEPGSIVLIGLGLGALGLAGRRRVSQRIEVEPRCHN